MREFFLNISKVTEYNSFKCMIIHWNSMNTKVKNYGICFISEIAVQNLEWKCFKKFEILIIRIIFDPFRLFILRVGDF